MGIGTAALNPKKNTRILIVCPPHLVRKWAREIKTTDPRAKTVKILENISDVELKKPIGREYWILSRERAKLHFSERSAYYTRKGRLSCPLCGTPIDFEDDDGKTCVRCEKSLVGANRLGMRRYAIAEYIKRRKNRCYIDLLIADEIHEMKGGDTAQGQALHALAIAADKTLAMTGTLMGGYSSNLYHLLFRLFTRKMMAHGFRHNSSLEFSSEYGVVETIIQEVKSANRTSSLGKDNTVKRTQEKPGVSPLLLPHFLLEESAFLWIEDVAAEAMPSYDEFIEIVPMDEEQTEVYDDFEANLRALVVEHSVPGSGKSKFLGAMVNSLFALPDGVRRGEIVYDPKEDTDFQERIPLIQATALDIPITNKEQRLIEIVQQEKAQGRKCAIYLEHTGTRDLIPDMQERLNNAGISTLILRSETTSTAKREDWIKKHVADENPDVLICNPNLVKTGLDLLEFPTIIYFQTGFNIYTLRQSSRRSWRIGQRKPVKVYFMAFAGTAQERAIRLIATKLETSNAVEGKLAADGLSAMSTGTSSLMFDLARSIMSNDVEKTSIAEVWNSYRQSEKAKMQEFEIKDDVPVTVEIIKPKVVTEPSAIVVDYVAVMKKARRKNGVAVMSVFDILDELETAEVALV